MGHRWRQLRQTSASIMARIMRRRDEIVRAVRPHSVLARYGRAMTRRPLLTNLCTAVPVMVAGDMLAQLLERCVDLKENDRPCSAYGTTVDLERTATMAAYSGMIFTPLFFHLYRWQDKILRGTPAVLAAKKAVCKAHPRQAHHHSR